MPRNGNNAERGYGYEHQRVRKAMLPYAVGSLCTRCGQPITATDDIDLDHNEDRTGYLGWAHSSCNRRAGANKGNAAKAKRTSRTSREW